LAPAPDTVLVVDDDLSVRTALKELFETEGYAVVLAANGRAALNQLHGGLRPRVILLDLMMPVMDGWDFRSEQLASADLKDIPVFILTAVGFSAETVRAQFGDIPFVPKPPAHEGLLEMVRRVCLASKSDQAATGS